MDQGAHNAAGVCAEEILREWNSKMGQDCKLTEKRVKALKQRLKVKTWAESWREAIDRAAKSDFLNGFGDRGWRADFEWFVRPDSLAKILEGSFDNRQQRTPVRTFAQQRVENSRRAMEEFANGS